MASRAKTHEDLYANYLNYRPEMMSSLIELRSPALNVNENLATNLMYGAAVADYAIIGNQTHCLKRVMLRGRGSFGRSIITRL
jgi:hypothetical protein